MYLTRLHLNHSRMAMLWQANPYRIHQRLRMACPEEPRLLYRIEEHENGVWLLVQSHSLPDWPQAFNEFPVLAGLPEMKTFDPRLLPDQVYAFRLTANPVVTRNGKRIGLGKEEDQLNWLARQLEKNGAAMLRCQVQPYLVQHSVKGANKETQPQTHLVVRFDGLLRCVDPEKLVRALDQGIGPAKAYGCGLLSVARI